MPNAKERSCSRRGASSRRRSPSFMLYMQLLSFVSAHYGKCIFKARQLWAKPQLWCDKFIFTKICNPMLRCFCRSPALLTQTERSVSMKELLKWSLWIIIDNGRNKFNRSYFSVTNSILVSFFSFLVTCMFAPKKARAIPVINVTALPLDPFSNVSTSDGEVSIAKECQNYFLQISSISCPPSSLYLFLPPHVKLGNVSKRKSKETQSKSSCIEENCSTDLSRRHVF